MSNKVHALLGLLLIAIPFFSGLPPMGETIVIIVIGLILVISSVLNFLRQRAEQESEREDARAYVENTEYEEV
jgi:hypothetical protein